MEPRVADSSATLTAMRPESNTDLMNTDNIFTQELESLERDFRDRLLQLLPEGIKTGSSVSPTGASIRTTCRRIYSGRTPMNSSKTRRPVCECVIS